MNGTITTLVLNLLVSESKLHRQSLAEHILELLDMQVGNFGRIEKAMRDYFVSHLMACVEDPTCKAKNTLFRLSEFYRNYYIEYVPELTVAA